MNSEYIKKLYDFYNTYPDIFVEQFCGIKLLSFQKTLMRYLGKNTKTVLYPARHNTKSKITLTQLILGLDNSNEEKEIMLAKIWSD